MNKKIELALKILIVASLMILVLLSFGVVILEGYLLKGEKRGVEKDVEIQVEVENEELVTRKLFTVLEEHRILGIHFSPNHKRFFINKEKMENILLF